MKKVFFILFLLIQMQMSVQFSSAQGLFNSADPSGCESKDPFLPNLLICGRNAASGACSQYTNPCTFGDFVETGRRLLIWVISIVLLIIPIIIAYYGVQMIFAREFKFGGKSLADLKQKILWLIIYFVCLLGAWLIVRSIVDVAQVNPRINTFLIENGEQVKARQFDFSR